MGNETTRHHTASLLVIRQSTDVTPCRAKPRTEIQPCMMNKPHDKFP